VAELSKDNADQKIQNQQLRKELEYLSQENQTIRDQISIHPASKAKASAKQDASQSSVSIDPGELLTLLGIQAATAVQRTSEPAQAYPSSSAAFTRLADHININGNVQSRRTEPEAGRQSLSSETIQNQLFQTLQLHSLRDLHQSMRSVRPPSPLDSSLSHQHQQTLQLQQLLQSSELRTQQAEQLHPDMLLLLLLQQAQQREN